MEQKLQDFIDKISSIKSQEELGGALLSQLRGAGYDNLVVAATRSHALKEVVWAELPQGYQPAYFEHRWDRIDPVLRATFQSPHPFSWTDVARPQIITPEQKRFFEDCKDIGVHSGVTIPLHGPGLRCDLISISARDRLILPTDDIAQLYAVATSAWFRLSKIREAEGEERRVRLSPRETECLQWVKDGKSGWEIGLILSISERTVEFHIKNAMQKLGVNNRLLACVVALQNGLITL